MKHKYFHIITILFFAAGIYAGDYLIAVDNLNEQAKKDLFVIEYVRNHFFVIANETDLKQMNTRKLSCQILDIDPRTKEYYLIFPIFESNNMVLNEYDAKIFGKYGRVIKRYEKFLLMDANLDDLLKITEYRVKLNHLDMDKLSFETAVDPEAMAIHKKPVKKNQYILDMLQRFEKESADSADRILRECVAFHNRFCNGKYMDEECNPWLIERFEAYGCDSIIITPVSGRAPVVSGVIYGKKNPGLTNGFVSVMGGHTDNILSGNSDLDARHQGAWDGGSQTVGYLEACRLLQYYEYENTIVFSSFCGEEHGFLGAKALLGDFDDAGVSTICGWNYDMIGWNGSVRLSTGDAPGSSDQAAKVRELHSTYDLDQYVHMSYVEPAARELWEERGTDLYVFNDIGYVANQIMGGGGGRIHTLADTINDNYSPEDMAAACIVGAVTLMEYAVPIGNSTKIIPNSTSSINNHHFSIQNMHGRICIRYSCKDQVPLSFTIYNSIGKAVATITPEKESQDLYTASLKYDAIGGGTYILNCKTTKGTISEKIMILK